jgi:hypothetical protein
MKRKNFNSKKSEVENLPLNNETQSFNKENNFSFEELISIFRTTNSNRPEILIPATISNTGEKLLVDFNKLNVIPNRKCKVISESLRLRIKKVYKKISEVHFTDYKEFENSLRKEGHPEREVHVFEIIGNTYQAYLANKTISINKRKQIYNVILRLSLGYPINRILENNPLVSVNDLDVLLNYWKNNMC